MKNTLKLPTKWEWIRDECEKLGMPEASKIANKIDESIKKLYPEDLLITPRWSTACRNHQLYKYDEPDVVEIMEVATNSLYCNACEYNESGVCNGCKFNINGGAILYKIFKHYLRRMQ